MLPENAKKVETFLRERDAHLMEVEIEVAAARLVETEIVVETAEEGALTVAEAEATVEIERRRRDGEPVGNRQLTICKSLEKLITSGLLTKVEELQ